MPCSCSELNVYLGHNSIKKKVILVHGDSRQCCSCDKEVHVPHARLHIDAIACTSMEPLLLVLEILPRQVLKDI